MPATQNEGSRRKTRPVSTRLGPGAAARSLVSTVASKQLSTVVLKRRAGRPIQDLRVGELVRKVASETGVALAAGTVVADEPVAVVVTALPARRLLEELAELLDYQWRRQGRAGGWRYEIGQDHASREREETLRRDALADVERRFQQEVRLTVEMAALPPEKIQVTFWPDGLMSSTSVLPLAGSVRAPSGIWLFSPV